MVSLPELQSFSVEGGENLQKDNNRCSNPPIRPSQVCKSGQIAATPSFIKKKKSNSFPTPDPRHPSLSSAYWTQLTEGCPRREKLKQETSHKKKTDKRARQEKPTTRNERKYQTIKSDPSNTNAMSEQTTIRQGQSETGTIYPRGQHRWEPSRAALTTRHRWQKSIQKKKGRKTKIGRQAWKKKHKETWRLSK